MTCFPRTFLALASTLSLALIASTAALATPVCGVPAITAVPKTVDGIYLDFSTGNVTTTQPPMDWDFDPYATNGATELAFYFNTGVAIAEGNTGLARVLPVGTTIDDTSTYSGITMNTDAQMATWRAGANGYLGFRFYDAVTGFYYGWLHMTSTAPHGFPATLVSYCYQTAPNTPIAAGAGGDLIFKAGFE